MEKFCTNCGKEITDGVAFCTACGVSVITEACVNESAPRDTSKNTKEEPIPPQITNTPVQPAQPMYQPSVPAVNSESKAVGTGAFFGLEFLLAFPVIGWLVCLIMAFAPKNKNIKHYARAKLIWIVIGIALCAIAYFVIGYFGSMLLEYIDEMMDGSFPEWSEVFEQWKQIENGGLNN